MLLGRHFLRHLTLHSEVHLGNNFDGHLKYILKVIWATILKTIWHTSEGHLGRDFESSFDKRFEEQFGRPFDIHFRRHLGTEIKGWILKVLWVII